MPKTGEKVKHYEILEPLGKGGMGEVHLAQDTVLDRKVAIKFLPEMMQKDATARVRLLREAKAAASLDHPFICKIYETGEINEKAFIVMEYVEGKDLKEKLDEGLLPLRDSLQMALEIAEALEEAHNKGIVHRDLKPSNIMLTPQGHVKVMDFGLAKQILPGGEESITKTLTQASITEKGAIVGTLAYMSPEQARGEPLDVRSDIFSLGIIIHEMTSGKHPFSKSSPIETLSSILRDDTPPINVKPKIANPVLSPVLRKALAKDPRDRYQNIRDFVVDIRKVQRETVAGSRLLYRRLPILAASVIIIALLVFTVFRFTRQPKVGIPETGPEPISVLIADFQNKTGDSAFDGSLEPALGISLEGAPFISVYQSAKARKLAIQIDPNSDGRLDPQLAQLISQREGINVVVNGMVESSGEGYTIKMWAMDIVTSERISEPVQTIKTKAEVLKAADSLASKLRSDLGDIPAESAEAIAKETFTTISLEAWKAYTQAQKLDVLGKYDEAIEEYRRAIAEDPDFGRAYSGLAAIYANRGQVQEAEKYYQMAMTRIDRMSDREKYRTRGGYYLMKKNHLKAIEEYTALVEKFPADSAGHSMLAYAYFLGRDMSKAVEEGRYAVELFPKKFTTRINLAWYAIAASDFELAEQEAQKALELNPSFEKAYVCLALSELGQGLSDQAVQTYQKLKTLSSFGASFAATGLADIAFFEGRLADVAAILKKGIAADLGNGRTYLAAYKWTILAHAFLLQGQKDLALDAADSAVSTSRKGDILFSAAQIYLKTGQENNAHDLAGELSKELQPVNQAYAKLVKGEISMTRGEIPEAIKLFREAQAQVDTWLGRFALGRAFLEAKAFTEAYSEFERCLKRRGEVTAIFLNDLPSYRYLPPIYYYLGRAQEGLGSPAASESYQKFLEIKANSDGGDPLVEDCLRRLALL